MNEFGRRLLEIVSQSSWIASVARRDRKIIGIEPYAYTGSIAAIASGADGQELTQVQSDSDFVLVYQSGSVVVDNAVVVSPYSLVQITDTGSGKTFFSEPTLWGLVYGQGGFPFLLPAPRVIAPNTNILTAVNNVSSANPATYYFAYWGARVYYANGPTN